MAAAAVTAGPSRSGDDTETGHERVGLLQQCAHTKMRHGRLAFPFPPGVIFLLTPPATAHRRGSASAPSINGGERPRELSKGADAGWSWRGAGMELALLQPRLFVQKTLMVVLGARSAASASASAAAAAAAVSLHTPAHNRAVPRAWLLS